MLTGTGRNLAFANAESGRLTFDWGLDGNPKFDDGEAELVWSLLLEAPGYFADRQGKRRSLLSTVKTRNAGTAGQIKQYAEDALEPGIADGRLRSASVSVETNGYGYLMLVSYVTRAGKVSTQRIPLTV